VRLDGRGELAAALRAAGRAARDDAPDVALVLEAWHAWGDAFVDCVHGDFALVLWDAPRRRLMAARDRFGVRPLWYARSGRHLLVSNTVDAIRAVGGMDTALDPAATVDFLAFGHLYDPAASPWAALRAVPPAHRLVARGVEAEVSPYWRLPVEPAPVPRRPEECVEAFRVLLATAVAERIDGAPTGILLSGGRDSSSVAAMAAEGMGGGAGLRAHTMAHDRLMPDRERHWSGVAARALGIPQRVHAVDGYRLFERWRDTAPRGPEPTAAPIPAIDADVYGAVAADAPVVLTGDGGDPLLSESRARLARLLAGGRAAAALGEAWTYLRLHRRLPRPGFRTLAAERRGERWTPAVPAWLRPEAVARFGLRERAAEIVAPPAAPHPLRPEAYERLASPFWGHWLVQYDADATGVPLEARHPLFDVRLAEFVLSVPPAQWYNDKGLLRIGMRGRLPEALLARPKTPLAGDPLALRLRRGDRLPPDLALRGELEEWVDARRLPAWAGGIGADDDADPWTDVRPACFSAWLTVAERPREP
jgi:asparagine synthase (glutamine-hydrolysing)